MKTLFAAAVVLLITSGCTSQALCEKDAECRDDPPGDDYVRICTIQRDGNIRALRANKEEECQMLADAQIALDACRAQLDCDDYNEGDLGQKCDAELDDFNDAFDDAENGTECSSRD
jgi:hypothetical protein